MPQRVLWADVETFAWERQFTASMGCFPIGVLVQTNIAGRLKQTLGQYGRGLVDGERRCPGGVSFVQPCGGIA